jgi:hypothetical protein
LIPFLQIARSPAAGLFPASEPVRTSRAARDLRA